MGRIVVGVDGSEEALNALRWAGDEARLRGAVLEAVYAYEYTPSWQRYAYAGEESVFGERELTELREAARRDVEEARQRAMTLVERAVKDAVPDGVEVEALAVEDRRPARALVERSKGADMLVVGSRGRGGFAGLMLGSVSQQCAHHAECPLVIISRPHASRSRRSPG